SGRYAAGAGAGDLGFAQCADRAGEVRGVPDVVRGGWRHRCGDVLPRSRGWDSDRPPLLPPLAGRELRPAASPPPAGDGRDAGNCRRLVVPVAMPRAPTPALPRVA